jgi:N-acetylgalactosamine 4-sulfate 6-O-sulfotransferase
LFCSNIPVDASTSYIWDFDDWVEIPGNAGLQEPKIIAAHFIKHFTPDAKFIILLRDPTERSLFPFPNSSVCFPIFIILLFRMYSDYLFVNHGGESTRDFHDGVVEGIALMKECMSSRTERSCLYDPTLNRNMRVRKNSHDLSSFKRKIISNR